MESKGAVSERTPLLGGASIVSVTAPDIINRAAESPAPGISLRESVERGKASGLVNDGYREEEEPVCCGQEQLAYSILARLPAIHTYAFLAFFLYFGHTWLLIQRPDIAVAIIGIFLVYAMTRFWIMWFSAFYGLSLLRKHDNREPNYWQSQTRPVGAPDSYSTIDTIAEQSIAKQIVLCMAMEERDPNAAVTNWMPNVLQVPAICGTRYTALSIARMAEMASPVTNPFPIAIYSLSLPLAKQAKFWDPTVIPEDWHMYFRCSMADQGKVEVTRLMILVGTEAVEGKNYVDTVKECYDQSVRWQWGATDVGYLMVQSSSRWDVPLHKRLSLLLCAYDHHLLTVALVISIMASPFLYGKIPVMLDLDMWTGAEMIVALQVILSWLWLFHVSLHFMFLCYMDHRLRNEILKNRSHYNVTEGFWANGPPRWASLIMFPFADIFLFIVPTVHAHTKMFISSNFNYVPSAKQGDRLPGEVQEKDRQV
ncbi:hypothetical protein GUITHDRAFT_122779 [Guillardia theta CCMP2712]|uniref:Glycosyltransferase 2-like domain-containing protein n=1 Tax=Guillardia theta (strain CCMP2712) TaxID=905079 RepID=L1I449_GUITC|nr:hypothetical protein GUITHDRAFT_122779 [Guillardia theta CCMP2712]EKX31016.1 hypothetical protein GUITHDRAFT_122779 [Guillardia theta CCMP2712]|eukprot:XP_005817996.1 hypothetical protein GUITHDRAFT_122779 [Guillardia theta CCMP2712]